MENKKINEISELILELISRREITYKELELIFDKVSCDARERLTFAPLKK